MNGSNPQGVTPPGPRETRVRCEEIQGLLFDYLSRELGPGQSDLVREHLRRCAVCQAAAAEIQATVNLLRRDSSQTSAIPTHLSAETRRHMLWAYAHPVMHWVERHHVVVSIAVAAIGLALVLLWLKHSEIWAGERPRGIPVIIGRPGQGPVITNEVWKEAGGR